MEVNEVCLLCGGKTRESHVTSIGQVWVHKGCLTLLEDLLQFEDRTLEPDSVMDPSSSKHGGHRPP